MQLDENYKIIFLTKEKALKILCFDSSIQYLKQLNPRSIVLTSGTIGNFD